MLPSSSTPRPSRPRGRLLLEAGCVAAGVLLLLWALQADVAWFDRRTMLSYYGWRQRYVRMALALRISGGALGVVLLCLVRPRIARWVALTFRRERLVSLLGIGLAVLLALGVGELALRRAELRRVLNPPAIVRMAQPHPRYGWLWIPSRSGEAESSRGMVRYAFNAHSNRAPEKDTPEDGERETILFTGESYALGYSLPFEETFAARAGAELGVQVVNLSVYGYGTDQAYLRLMDALPRFSRPVAVVSLFTPIQIDRNLAETRPHLVLFPGDRLALMPAQLGFFQTLRLRGLLAELVPYRLASRLDASIALARSIVRRTVEESRARGAIPLFLVPSFVPPRWRSTRPEAWLTRTLFAEQGAPHVVVDIEPEWVPVEDGHPDARGARRIAAALVSALRALGIDKKIGAREKAGVTSEERP